MTNGASLLTTILLDGNKDVPGNKSGALIKVSGDAKSVVQQAGRHEEMVT